MENMSHDWQNFMCKNRFKLASKPKLTKNFYERASWAQNQPVIGVDEVGRGCLAGPLVAAAVMLPIAKAPAHLKDSKLIDHEERLKAYRWIMKHCHYGVGIVHHRLIDERNIWQANLIAMQKALLALLASTPERPAAILTDAVPINLLDTAHHMIPVHSFAKGEKYSSSIAAASILAKVTRDALMTRLDTIFPGYKLAQHKGYCTAIHQNAVRTIGPSLIHRMSFLKNIMQEDVGTQTNLFSSEIEL